MKEVTQKRFLFISATILIAAVSRLIPHPYNFTPIGAMALFGGAMYSKKRLAFILPLAAMFLSDLIISGFTLHNTILYVYASFILITTIGILIGKNPKVGNLILASITSSVLFFLITNFGVWAQAGFIGGINGLATTLFAGVPFFNNNITSSFFANTLAGDLFYTTVLFGSYAVVKMKVPSFA